MASIRADTVLRYEPDERCSPLLSLIIGVQGTLLTLPITIAVVTVTILSSGQGEDYLTWAIFASLIVVAIVTALQASQIWRIGAGHVVLTGISPNYIAVGILALETGGPFLLSSLLVATTLLYLVVGARLYLLRKVITPTVCGTVLLLIGTSMAPITLGKITEVPEGASPAAGLYVVAATLAVAGGMMLRTPRPWRPWALIAGIGCGCLVAAPFGYYDLELLRTASWVGFPSINFSGVHLVPPAEFWALLPIFAVVTLVQAVKGVGDQIVIQRAARRQPRSTDFRLLQGSIYANGLGALASAVVGIPPTTFFSSMTVSLGSLTGVAARSVGYAVAVVLLAAALIPKLTVLLVMIPAPVLGAILIVAMGLLLIQGMQSVMQEGMDITTTFIVGVPFGVGAVMQHQNVFDGLLAFPWNLLLGNGVTMGGFLAIAFNTIANSLRARPNQLTTRLDVAEIPAIDAFLKEQGASAGWDEPAISRLRSAGEEAVSSLLQPDNEFVGVESQGNAPRLVVSARTDGDAMDLEFVSVVEEENLGDRLAYLEEEPQVADEREISFRLLRHYATSVRHQKYHGMDIIAVRVES